MESLSLIDVTAEDDLFLGLASPPALTPPPDREPPRAGFRWGAAEAAADLVPTGGSPAAADPYGATEDQAAPERAESPKQRKAKTGVNLRKSLAWDSAFFTSEGVLDTEELAIVNSTFRKTQGSRLPGITEENRRSGESTTSTLESETWAMESIETELFDNVRASIQRSLGKPNKVTAKPPATSKLPRAAANSSHGAARKAIDQMPQIKTRAPVSTSQGVGGKQRPQATSNKPTATRVALPEDKEAKPSSRPPRALPRVATMRSSTNTSIASGISDKRSSTGGVGNRQAVGKSANTSAGVRPGGVMKSSSVPKTGALIPATTKPDTKNKSATLSSTTRKAQRIPVHSSSKSDSSKANPTRSSGNKIPARIRNDCASPTISPNSSIDSMSSVISGASTASTVGKMSHTSESFSSLPPSLRNSNDHPLTTKLRPAIVTEGQSLGQAASGDSLIAIAGTTNKGKGSKPSGLRRPNPKIGYFDAAEKSTDQVQSSKIQLLLPSTPKSKLSCTQMTSTAASSIGQEELKYTPPPEETGTSNSRAVMALSVQVSPMDAVPFEVAEPEACSHENGPVVAQPEAEKSIDQNIGTQVKGQPMDIQLSLPGAPKCQLHSTQTTNLAASTLDQQELRPTDAPHEESSALKSKAVKMVALEVEKAEPFNTVKTEIVKAAENETYMYQASPLVTATEASKENIPALHQNIQANDDASSLSVDLLIQKLSSISLGLTPDMTS